MHTALEALTERNQKSLELPACFEAAGLIVVALGRRAAAVPEQL